MYPSGDPRIVCLLFLAHSSLVGPEVEQHSLPPTPIVGVDYPYDLAVSRARLAPTAAASSSYSSAAGARSRRRVEGWPEGEAACRALSHPVDQEGVARAAVVGGDEVLHFGTNVLPSVLNLPRIKLSWSSYTHIPCARWLCFRSKSC